MPKAYAKLNTFFGGKRPDEDTLIQKGILENKCKDLILKEMFSERRKGKMIKKKKKMRKEAAQQITFTSRRNSSFVQ
eukprot:jgi/Bigna1/145643/aug1.101_g20351